MLNLTRDHLASDPSAAASTSGRLAHAPLLWIPYVLIALVFVVFLGANFWCYHKKHRERYLRKRDEKRVKEGLHERRRITVLMRAHFQSAFLRDSHEENQAESDKSGCDDGIGLDNGGGDIYIDRLDSMLFPQLGGWATDEKSPMPSWGSGGSSSLPTFIPDLPQPPATHAAHHYRHHHHHPYRYPPPQTQLPPKSQPRQNAFPPCLFSDLFPATTGLTESDTGRPTWAFRPDLLAEKVLLQSPAVASLASPEDLSPLDSFSTSAVSSPGTSPLVQGGREGERGGEGESPLTAAASSWSTRLLPTVTLPAPKPLPSPASSANGACRTGRGWLTGPITDHDQTLDRESVSREEDS